MDYGSTLIPLEIIPKTHTIPQNKQDQANSSPKITWRIVLVYLRAHLSWNNFLSDTHDIFLSFLFCLNNVCTIPTISRFEILRIVQPIYEVLWKNEAELGTVPNVRNMQNSERGKDIF